MLSMELLEMFNNCIWVLIIANQYIFKYCAIMWLTHSLLHYLHVVCYFCLLSFIVVCIACPRVLLLLVTCFCFPSLVYFDFLSVSLASKQQLRPLFSFTWQLISHQSRLISQLSDERVWLSPQRKVLSQFSRTETKVVHIYELRVIMQTSFLNHL